MAEDSTLGLILSRLDRIETKLDYILEKVPTFVTWRKLGGLTATLITLAVAVLSLP